VSHKVDDDVGSIVAVRALWLFASDCYSAGNSLESDDLSRSDLGSVAKPRRKASGRRPRTERGSAGFKSQPSLISVLRLSSAG
jgi:hypothetical protein